MTSLPVDAPAFTAYDKFIEVPQHAGRNLPGDGVFLHGLNFVITVDAATKRVD